MPALLYMRRKGQTLIPASAAEACQIERLPVGKPLRVQVAVPRGSKFHRLTWAFFNLVAEALNAGPSAAPWRAFDVKAHLLVATGHCREIKAGGRVGFVPISTAFEAMTQDEYGKWFDAALLYVRDHLCRWIQDSDEWPEIVKIMETAGVEIENG